VFASVSEAVADLAAGRFVVLVGTRGDEDQGHLAITADAVSAEAVSFMAREGRGVICVSLSPERVAELRLRRQATTRHSRYDWSVGVSIEAREGVTTGISAADRARTILVAASPEYGPEDLVQPGHVIPLRAVEGGVLRRAGRTEAAVDLARMAGRVPAAAVCEVLDEDGSVAGLDALRAFAARHGLRLLRVEDLVEHRWREERLVSRATDASLPTGHGPFSAVAFSDLVGGETHLALVRGAVAGGSDVLVHVHEECLPGDAFASRLCTCAEALGRAFARLSDEDAAVLVYLTRKRRGAMLLETLASAGSVEPGLAFGAAPRVPAAGVAAQIVADLAPASVRVLADGDGLRRHFEAAGVPVAGVVRLGVDVEGASRAVHQRWP